MGLTVQIVLDEEVAFLLEVDAAVVAHKALGVVELVPSLHDGATAEMKGDRQCKTYEGFNIFRNHGDEAKDVNNPAKQIDRFGVSVGKSNNVIYVS